MSKELIIALLRRAGVPAAVALVLAAALGAVFDVLPTVLLP